ncbi:peptidoglycan-binding domain-containing protein [Streptomyces sp. AS58]|uniref:peptidoglycan-binding domain-containing protein n=1 Tax=Streptomyces sp. AS58 TaxID=1519489 RepID=UPI000AF7844B|nr:peptidoglycan-binding domain-containing protein [Streptomyces sp. AS58]
MPENEQQVPAVGLVHKRRWIVGVAAGAVLVSSAGLAAAQIVKSPAQAAVDSAAPPASVITAAVEYRVLADSVILRGAVTAEQTVDVSISGAPAEASAAVVTKLRVRAGEQFKAGQVLLEVSGRPVFVLPGEVPVYRDLKPGMDGDDVTQLQTALRDIGHGTGTDREGYFGAGTKAALHAFYTSVGYDPLPATTDGDAEVEAARDGVTEAERALEDALAPDGEAGEDVGATDPAEKQSPAPSREAERAREDLRKARETLADALAASGPMLPASEAVFLSSFPARVDSINTKVGSVVADKLLTVSAGALVVNGYLQQHQKGLVRPGQKVQILSEVTGVSAAATVASVSDTLQQERSDTTDGNPGMATPSGYLMVVEPTKELPSELAGQDVRLTVQAASTKGKALVVPVSAITAGADGRTSVTVLTSADTKRKVTVTTGTTGDGYVEVRLGAGARLAEGDRVIIGTRNHLSGEQSR